MNYWLKRIREAQKNISDKSIDEINEQLIKLYGRAMKKTIADFEATYNKVLLAIGDGKEPTPADLYKLDKYWETQAQLKAELQKLGDREVELLSKQFVNEYENIYKAMAMNGETAFTAINKENANKLINSIWCSDGKSWSQRVWKNNENLIQLLNDELIHCVTTGKKTSDLKNLLQQKFNASYTQADRLVRTEIAHIETQAAADRYKEYGIKKFKFFADTDKRTCELCAKLDGKEFFLDELSTSKNAPPLHPSCRCCIVPITEDDKIQTEKQDILNKNDNNSKKIEQEKPTDKQETIKEIPLSQDDEAVIKAQELTKALQNSEKELEFYNKSERHIKHAEDLTGNTGGEAWEGYVKIASDLLKKDIDGEIIQGFVTNEGTLFKYDTKNNLFAILSKYGTISTCYKPKESIDYWLEMIKDYKGG